MSNAAAVRTFAILHKEWLDLRRNRTVLGTLIALPTLLTVVACGMIVAAAQAVSHGTVHPGDMQKLPAYLQQLSSDPHEAALFMLANTALMLFSMVPVLLPSIMAAHSIAGEKLQRSLEPLLATPIRTWELLVGKIAAMLIPTLIPSVLGYAVYVAIASRVVPPRVLDMLISAPFVLSIVLIGPLSAVAAVTFGVMVSSRAADLQSAQGLSGLVVLPVIGLGMGQTFGAVSVTVSAVLIKALVLLILDVGGLLLCVSVFERETILARWK